MPNVPPQALDRDAGFPRVPQLSTRYHRFQVDAREPSALIADDDPDIHPLVATALKPFHFRTETVASGADALVRLRALRYDLVVLDLEMIGVHGFDVLRALRELPLYERVPVLVLTANSTDDAIARSFGYGADEFVK